MAKKNLVTYGFPAKYIARVCRVTERTATRWKSGHVVMPETAKMILAGDLGCFDPDWRGWILRRGELISPENWAITMSDVLSAPLLRFQLEAYKSENRELKRKWDAYEEQPLPADMPQIKSVVA